MANMHSRYAHCKSNRLQKGRQRKTDSNSMQSKTRYVEAFHFVGHKILNIILKVMHYYSVFINNWQLKIIKNNSKTMLKTHYWAASCNWYVRSLSTINVGSWKCANITVIQCYEAYYRFFRNASSLISESLNKLICLN